MNNKVKIGQIWIENDSRCLFRRKVEILGIINDRVVIKSVGTYYGSDRKKGVYKKIKPRFSVAKLSRFDGSGYFLRGEC